MLLRAPTADRFGCGRCGAVTMLEWSLFPVDAAACNDIMGVQLLPHIPSFSFVDGSSSGCSSSRLIAAVVCVDQ